MTERIKESISGRVNPDVQKWYEAKLKELAHFLAKQINSHVMPHKNYEPVKTEELEVAVK